MPCYQSPNFPPGFTTTGRTSYATEADCNQACQEGACCTGTTCSVKPQCQCQGANQTFKGLGTTCGTSSAPVSIPLTLTMRSPFTQFVSRGPSGGSGTASGSWVFDYSCWAASYTLARISNPYTWGYVNTQVNISTLVSTSGSFGPGGNSTSCSCPIPLIQPSAIYTGELTVSRRTTSSGSVVCGTTWDLNSAWAYDLVPDGQSPLDVRQPVQVPTFCSGSYRINGTVWGPGDVSHGTFVIGNPLP
jgi:hypothetical protein